MLGAYHKIEMGYRVMLSGSYALHYGSRFESIRNYPDLKKFNMCPLKKQDWQRLNELVGVWARQYKHRWVCANPPFTWEVQVNRVVGEEEYRLHYPREYAEEQQQVTNIDHDLNRVYIEGGIVYSDAGKLYCVPGAH